MYSTIHGGELTAGQAGAGRQYLVRALAMAHAVIDLEAEQQNGLHEERLGEHQDGWGCSEGAPAAQSSELGSSAGEWCVRAHQSVWSSNAEGIRNCWAAVYDPKLCLPPLRSIASTTSAVTAVADHYVIIHVCNDH